MSLPPAPLTDDERERVHRAVVPDWVIERLDVQLGTAGVVAWMKPQLQCWGSTGRTDEGPYPEFAFRISRVPTGYDAQVIQGDEVLRAGRLVWNELANRTTFAALAWRRTQARAEEGPRPGEQTALEL